MLRFEHFISDSKIPMAGKGLFTKENLTKARVVIIPNQSHIIYSAQELSNFPPESIEQVSSVRWFEDVHTVDPEWSSESHLNHSFTPNCLWHLGFVFALRDILVNEELTIDYRMLLDETTVLDFKDSVTGHEIRGITWPEKMKKSVEILSQLFS